MSRAVTVDNRALESIARFFHFWAAPALLPGLCAGGAKLVTLARAAGIDTRTAARGMAELVALGLARRNPGHGHPMRPEYLPAPRGLRVGETWQALRRGLAHLHAEDAAHSKWRVPVLVMIASGIARFGELQGTAHGLTPRALALALRGLAQAGLVERQIESGFPPGVAYALQHRSRRLQRLAIAFANSFSV